jgi:hypothetical protein
LESEEARGEVLGGAQFGRGQPDDDAVVAEDRVVVGPCGQLDREGARVRCAGREDRARREEFPIVVPGSRGHAPSPFSIVRPA